MYKIGSVVPVTVGSKQIYLLANSTLNPSNRSSSTDDDLRNSLGELWVYIASSGAKDTLSIPILGTGMGRLKTSREKVIKEITIIDLSRNFGHHYAIQAGLNFAKGDYIFLIDNDLQ